MTSLIVAQTEESIIKAVAQYWLEAALTTVESSGQFHVALSGGNTPKKLFSLLSDDYFRSRMPWKNSHFFWVDERCVPPQHPDSNYGMAKHMLLSRVPIPENNIHRMPGETTPPQAAAKAYEHSLKSFFKLDKSMPHFDLILLGMGEDGHTASLFPATQALHDIEHWVTANFVEKLSSHRLTFTFPLINEAKRVAFLCAGESKASIVREVFRDDISMTRYPAQKVNPVKGELTWFFDTPATSKLKGPIADTLKHI